MKSSGKITTIEAAAIIGSSPQFVRAAMQQGKIDIGCAIKMPHSSIWTYNISPELLGRYSGKDIAEELSNLRSGKG